MLSNLSKSVYLQVFFVVSLLINACGNITSDSAIGDNSDFPSPDIKPADDQQLTEEQRRAYQQDAEKLAVRYVNEKDSTLTDIPDDLITVLYNGLVHVALSENPKAVEVTQTYNIHSSLPNPREVLVYADTTASWIEAWENGDTATGNPNIDQIIEQFDFQLTDYQELTSLGSAIATLHASYAINGYAVGRLFEGISGIQNAGPDEIIGGNTDVSVLFFDDHLRYNFKYGSGDCPSGCINMHSWYFNVFSDGSVEFIKEEQS